MANVQHLDGNLYLCFTQAGFKKALKSHFNEYQLPKAKYIHGHPSCYPAVVRLVYDHGAYAYCVSTNDYKIHLNDLLRKNQPSPRNSLGVLTMAKYMQSKSANLLCQVSGKDEDKYRVINGGWEGVRNGDELTIVRTGRVTTITDWVEVDPTKWPRAKQEQWYFY